MDSQGHVVNSQPPNPPDSFSAVLRFRATPSLETRLQRIANHRVKKLPEIAREAVVEFVEREERRLGLVPVPSPAQPQTVEAA